MLALGLLEFHLNAGHVFKIRLDDDRLGVTDPGYLAIT